MSTTYTLTTDELSSSATPAFFVFAKSNTAKYELIIYSFDYLNKSEYNILTNNIRESIKNKSYTISETDLNRLEIEFEFTYNNTTKKQTFYMNIDNNDHLLFADELNKKIMNTAQEPLLFCNF